MKMLIILCNNRKWSHHVMNAEIKKTVEHNGRQEEGHLT